jgi:hypothetical protein
MNNLESLSLAILQYPTTKVITQDQKPLVLTIKKLKRFMVHEKKTLITVSNLERVSFHFSIYSSFIISGLLRY